MKFRLWIMNSLWTKFKKNFAQCYNTNCRALFSNFNFNWFEYVCIEHLTYWLSIIFDLLMNSIFVISGLLQTACCDFDKCLCRLALRTFCIGLVRWLLLNLNFKTSIILSLKKSWAVCVGNLWHSNFRICYNWLRSLKLKV